MNILVFNCGSSSLNYKVFTLNGLSKLSVVCSGKAHRVGVKGYELSFIEHHSTLWGIHTEHPIPDHRTAAKLILDYLNAQQVEYDIIGHRFVHGGSIFQQSTWLTADIESDLQSTLPLASIHNPNTMSVIEVCREMYKGKRQYLTFDTAFHSTLPKEAYRYLLLPKINEKFGFRKYGFHGLSYQFVSREAADYLNKPLKSLRIIACHLGTGGSSVVAIQRGWSIDTTMGYTPLAGLVMSTRTGDLDPILVLRLMEDLNCSPTELDEILNKKSGLLGVSNSSSDIRDLIKLMDNEGNKDAALAYNMYTSRLRKTIGGYVMLLHGVDVLIFTDDIGIQNPLVRRSVCEGMDWCGIDLDLALNEMADIEKINAIQSDRGKTVILAMPTDEELVIAREGARLALGGPT